MYILTKFAFSLLFLFGLASAHAGGAKIAGATEPTQIMNNIELLKVASDGAVTASKTVSQYMLQLQQFDVQLRNIASLGNLPPGLGGDVVKAYQSLTNFRGAIQQLQGSLNQQQNVLESRLTEAKLSGRDWQTYLNTIANDVTMHRGRALERLKYEQQVLEQVQSDYEFARDLQGSIPATVGMHQSIQMMNTQMNRVISQNAKLQEIMSATIKSAAEDDAKKALDLQRRATDLETMRNRQEAINAKQRAFGGLE